ncbi:MAG: SAM-dependent methyltransferase [Clostridiales bacterium]|nr:SAM-dependent methyltransferase [Clostridiales bacterium]
MPFQLNQVVPWGRNFQEYREMFLLSEADLHKQIISFADGPASFNQEATVRGCQVTSLDPIYQFSAGEIRRRILETKDTVLEQARQNADRFNWDKISSVEHLETVRMRAMEGFLADYEPGKAQGRYVCHTFPDRTKYPHNAFDLGLCSHFLLLYPDLGLEFHIETIGEMLRICREVRISPMVDLDGNPPAFLPELLARYENSSLHQVEIVPTAYAFLKTENQFLRITKT